MWGTLGPYLGLCLLITISPGLDTAVVIRSTLKGGASSGLRTAAGCALGLFVHAAAVALGLAQLLLRSESAFEAVKLTGAAFLVLLGVRSLWAIRHAKQIDAEITAAGKWARPTPRSAFAQGLITNLTNPKATLFFVATLPQFVPTGEPARAIPASLGLATIAVLFSLTGLSVVAMVLGRMRSLLSSPRFRRVQAALLGATLIAVGVRVAAE